MAHKLKEYDPTRPLSSTSSDNPSTLNTPYPEPSTTAPTNFQREIYASLRRPPFSTKFWQWESQARALVPAGNFGYVAGSAGSGSTNENNRAAFQRYRIRPRMLVDCTQRDLSTTLFAGTRHERKFSQPLMFAPIGVQEIMHKEAETATGRAAGELGVPLVLSTAATRTIEEVAFAQQQGCADGEKEMEQKASKGPIMGRQEQGGERWFQLYWPRPQAEDVTVSLLNRAKASGFTALVVTLDTFLLGWRPEDLDYSYLPFAWGQGCQIGLSDPVFTRMYEAEKAADTRSFSAKAAEALDFISRPGTLGGALSVLKNAPTMKKAQAWINVMNSGTYREWQHLELLRRHWDGPIVLKGIQTAEDARKAVEAGMDGIIVSNHGGRQMNGAIASLDALAEIGADETVRQSGITLLFDSGVRTGADALKALALGAKAVLIGRPYMYGLAIGGKEGVKHVMKTLLGDLDNSLANMGKTNLAELSREDLSYVEESKL